ncbi:hypothetical protein KY285_023712 [Solanum tuberosum]|nr:hypothetical protein KY289_024039 [Solanum tuberosum]KAH0675911.1 hypothetical protein KY285_023712 [Solanum tuberosum]
MDDELAIIKAENLSILTNIPFNKKSKRDRSVRIELEKFEKNVNAKFVEMKEFLDSSFRHIIEELKSLQSAVSTNKYVGVEQSYKMKGSSEESKDQCVNETYNAESRTVLKEGLNRKDAAENRFVTPWIAVEGENTQAKSFGVVEVEDTHVTPVQNIRTKLPGKYAQSPYTYLSESGGTSGNTLIYCLWKHPFVHYKGFNIHNDVIPHFKNGKTSFFTAATNPIDPPFEFGVGRVNLMDWFYPSTYPGHPWKDLHVGMIMYYLRMFCKYGPDNSARVTTSDPFFISWVVQIHNALEANGK